MIYRLVVLILGGLALAAGPAGAGDPGRLGTVHVSEPERPPTGLVLLFSAGAWSAEDAGTAASLAAAGALVVGVETRAFIDRLDQSDEACHLAVQDIEAVSRDLQRARGWSDYLTPILAGTGEGGAVAAEIRAQAPPATIAGAVVVAPTATIKSRQPFCAPVPPVLGPEGYHYAPPSEPSGFLIQGTGPLAPLILPHLVAPAVAPTGSIAGLPLTDLPVEPAAGQPPPATLAVVLSGDGGWRDIDKSIAEALQASGIPVVGWDSLRYFWSRKTPDQTAADLAAVLQAYQAKWGARRVLLIGYSFGADVLPAVYDRLPAAVKRSIVQISLLALGTGADFEISMAGWLGAPPSADALPIAPALTAIPSGLIQCFYGADETDTLCPSLAPQGIEVIKTGGGHHFDGDYEAIATRIRAGLARRGG